MMYTGLGASTGVAVEQTVGNVAAGVVPGVLASQGIIGTIAAGSLAVPLIGAAIAGVTALVGIFMAKNAQYHAQETATTQIVNQAEQLMQQNLAAWNQSTKTQSEQAQAITNFNNIWAQVVKACDQQQYGDPGQRCISDRERGGQWPWPVYYLDPIQNDANVQPDPVSGVVDSALSQLSGIGGLMPLLLIGGLLLVVMD